MDFSPQAVENRLERVVEGFSSPRLLHYHRQRYELALRFISASDRVVDCACGTGYGARTLAARARWVCGLDVSPLAIAYCKRHYSRPNISFGVAAAQYLPLASGGAEVFCAFETLEHLEHPELFLREAARVLKPGGKLLISIPNRVAAGLKRGEKPRNPHHRREWSLLELDAWIQPWFQERRYFGQRIRAGSVLGRLSPRVCGSRWKRLAGKLDFTPIPSRPAMLAGLDDPGHWQPEYYFGVFSEFSGFSDFSRGG
jgi:ubiquinone/menaquinone biosynthesis C-methylase UbiE